MTLHGRVALVTGAASGIGKACADHLESIGARVLRADIKRPDARVEFLDTTDPEAWRSLLARFVNSEERLDILINAAGVSLMDDTLARCTPDIWRQTMAVNLLGPVIGMKLVLPIMRQQGGGSIINIVSVLAHRGAGDAAAYSASKGGLLLATKSAALLCAKETPAIRVNSISPGYVDTPLISGWAASISDNGQALNDIVDAIPMGRLGASQDVAELAVFLAGDDAAAITGSDFIVDGGLSGQIGVNAS